MFELQLGLVISFLAWYSWVHEKHFTFRCFGRLSFYSSIFICNMINFHNQRYSWWSVCTVYSTDVLYAFYTYLLFTYNMATLYISNVMTFHISSTTNLWCLCYKSEDISFWCFLNLKFSSSGLTPHLLKIPPVNTLL